MVRRSGPRRSATWASGSTTPPEEIARIPATGPVVVVSNHPSGLVDGMVLAEMVNRVRSDFRILTRSLLTGIPEVEEFMIPVPFPHEDNARELGLQMREDTLAHLKAGGVIILFPAGKVAMSEGWWGPAVEGEWNVFTHKIVRSPGRRSCRLLPRPELPPVPDRQPGVGYRAAGLAAV
jgi:putative hemolysin